MGPFFAPGLRWKVWGVAFTTQYTVWMIRRTRAPTFVFGGKINCISYWGTPYLLQAKMKIRFLLWEYGGGEKSSKINLEPIVAKSIVLIKNAIYIWLKKKAKMKIRFSVWENRGEENHRKMDFLSQHPWWPSQFCWSKTPFKYATKKKVFF